MISSSFTRSLFPPQASTLDKAHGRIETREIELSEELRDYLKFPYAHTTFRLERTVTDLDGTNPRHEVVYGLTSLWGTDRCAAKRLLGLVRGHWTIENRLHYVRDVTFDEDRSQIRKGSGPQVMATLRNVAISLLRIAGAKSLAKATRWCSSRVEACLRLIGLAAGAA